MRGIIGVEAMVRHGKKLSEGKEGEGGVSRQSSLTPFHLAFGMILSGGGLCLFINV